MSVGSARLPLARAGHGQRPRSRSPFGPAAPSIVAALGYTVLLGVWLVAGDVLPGGRWFAIHLFTLGVMTNLVLTFSEHFGRTVTRTSGERAAWWPLVTNLGVALTLLGLPTGWLPLLAVGATTVTVSVIASYRRLRRMRREALGARFAWIVRVYERAHGAFVHGAVLGALLGVGLIGGVWYGPVRLAHLHANVLGWGGLTLLATLVFFGPTMARCRIEPGADDRAARALRWGATGLSVAVVLLLATGLSGGPGLVAQLGAGISLAVYAAAASLVCAPVFRAVWRAKPTAPRPLVLGVTVWLPVVAWMDAVLVASGSWRWLDALGVIALVGVLGQAAAATLVYLAPMLRGRTTETRELVRTRLEVGARSRAIGINLGVASAATGGARVVGELPLVGVGLGLVLLSLMATFVVAMWPLER
jgi:hypothetical protein